MSAVDLPCASHADSILAELHKRQPALASYGLVFLGFALVTAALPLMDGRTLDGVTVWAKPSKFFLSTGVFMLTSAWFFGFVRPERRNARALAASVWTLIAAGTFELGYITFQAAQGQRSHFNVGDPLHYVLYAMMGTGATIMLLTKIPLAIEIARRPRAGLDPALRRAATIGMAMTVLLGGFAGIYMSQQYGQGHNVGPVGGAAPLFGWNRLGGDLRVAHFFGMHGEQILPIVAWATAGLSLVARRRIVLGVAAGLTALTIAVFVQATTGRAFLAF